MSCSCIELETHHIRDDLPVGPDHRRAPGPGPLRLGARVWLSGLGQIASDATDREQRDPVSLAIRPCGTDAASKKGASSRFLSECTLSSRSRKPSRGPPVREDTAERPESGSAEPAMISEIWAARFSGTRRTASL